MLLPIAQHGQDYFKGYSRDEQKVHHCVENKIWPQQEANGPLISYNEGHNMQCFFNHEHSTNLDKQILQITRILKLDSISIFTCTYSLFIYTALIPVTNSYKYSACTLWTMDPFSNQEMIISIDFCTLLTNASFVTSSASIPFCISTFHPSDQYELVPIITSMLYFHFPPKLQCLSWLDLLLREQHICWLEVGTGHILACSWMQEREITVPAYFCDTSCIWQSFLLFHHVCLLCAELV